jgi:hypothetical protein
VRQLRLVERYRFLGGTCSYIVTATYYNMKALNTSVIAAGQKTLAGDFHPSKGGFNPARK